MAGAPSGWGSNAWGEQFWEDNGLVLIMVHGVH